MQWINNSEGLPRCISRLDDPGKFVHVSLEERAVGRRRKCEPSIVRRSA